MYKVRLFSFVLGIETDLQRVMCFRLATFPVKMTYKIFVKGVARCYISGREHLGEHLENTFTTTQNEVPLFTKAQLPRKGISWASVSFEQPTPHPRVGRNDSGKGMGQGEGLSSPRFALMGQALHHPS